MDFREFSGKTVEDAIIEAATTLGMASSELEIETVSKGTSGFLGIGAKPAVIKARPKKEVSDDLEDIMATAKKPGKQPKKASKPAEKQEKANKPEKKEAPVEKTEKPAYEKKEKAEKKEFNKESYDSAKKDDTFDSKEKTSSDNKNEVLDENVVIDDSIVDETKEYLKKLFETMEIEAVIDVSLDKSSRTMNIDVEGPEMGVLIGKRGQTLDALQYLISLYVNKKSDVYIRVKLDTENYRERRKETLENLAKNIAFKVKKSRRPFTLEPMNPYERRIIHSTLQGDRFVTTKSEGEEPYRKVVVYPKKNNR